MTDRYGHERIDLGGLDQDGRPRLLLNDENARVRFRQRVNIVEKAEPALVCSPDKLPWKYAPTGRTLLTSVLT